MSIEDSMIEAGFHDEETYLEHLIDEAEEITKNRQNHELSWESLEREKEFRWEDSDEYNEELEKHIDKYGQWVEDNPFKFQLFIAWIDISYRRDYDDYYFFIKRFLEWEQNEELCINQLKEKYGDFYQKIVDYFEWKSQNLIENYLRQPEILYYDKTQEYGIKKLPPDVILKNEVMDYERWVEYKEDYDRWYSKFDDCTLLPIDLEVHWNAVCRKYFDGNQSIFCVNHQDEAIISVRKAIVKQIDAEIEPIKDLILDWFDNNPIEANSLYIRICCIKERIESEKESLIHINNTLRDGEERFKQMANIGIMS